MRWIHVDRDNAVEAKALADKRRRIDAWWDAFASRRADIEAHIRGTTRWDLPAFMREHLDPLDPEIEWEYGAAVSGEGHRLVITPHSEHRLFPMVRTIVERAPRVAGWEFHARHPASPFDYAMRIVAGRADVDLAGTTVEVKRQPWGRLDLRFHLPRKVAVEDARARTAVLVATQSLVGEQVLHQWIGEIEVRRQGRFHRLSFGEQPRDDVPLAQLASLVQRHVTRLLDERPDRPCIDRDDEVSLLKLSDDQVRKGAGRPTGTEHGGRTDIFVGTAALPGLWRAARFGLPIWSESFSRHGEVFGYVKLDGAQGLEGSVFAHKGEIEDALDEPLRAARAGCLIGGGSGLRYSYVDFALLDVEAGVRIMRDILREGNVNRRSWILFFDSVLEDEWIGIHPDTPPPPRAEDAAAAPPADRATFANRIRAAPERESPGH